MTGPAAVTDTNVIVSGLLTSERTSPTAKIVDAMLRGRFTYLLSLDLLAEYRIVWLRPAIQRRHRLVEAEAEAVLTELTMNGTVHEPTSSGEALDDVGDRHLWALLETTATAILVTGDASLRRRAPDPTRVMSPRQFLARFPVRSP